MRVPANYSSKSDAILKTKAPVSKAFVGKAQSRRSSKARYLLVLFPFRRQVERSCSERKNGVITRLRLIVAL